MVRLVLDTGVFYRLDALEQLKEVGAPIILPATVYMERGRQLLARGVPLESWDRTIREYGFIVEPFSSKEAARQAVHIHDERRWRRLYRDAMIAGHVGPHDVLWTTNPRDFLEVGLEAGQVVGV
jgi:predicted nucleic acid-binding protein